MKNLSKKIALFSLLTIAFFACKKDEIPPLGEPASKLEGISDTWTLSKVEQYDEKVAGSEFIFYDITDVFLPAGSEAPSITFDAGAKSYAYDPKAAPNFLGASGSWRFDNDATPTFVLATDAATGIETSWTLGGPTRPVDNVLELYVKRGCVDDATFYYVFTFTRQ